MFTYAEEALVEIAVVAVGTNAGRCVALSGGVRCIIDAGKTAACGRAGGAHRAAGYWDGLQFNDGLFCWDRRGLVYPKEIGNRG